jgi:putative hydrolase of the HAD superfamily
MTIKVITFDLDNTLWDVDPVIRRAEQAQYEWLRQYRPIACDKFSLEQMRDIKNEFHRQNPQFDHQISELRTAALTAMLVSVGYSQSQADSGAQQAFAEFMNLRHQVTFYEKALETLELLASRFTLGALTNGNADVSKMDAGDYFDFSYSAEQVNASKPHPAMFEAALSTCAIKAAEAIHVGDNPEHDIIGAQQVGMYTIWVNTQGNKWPGGKRPHGEINHLEELPEAIETISAAIARSD